MNRLTGDNRIMSTNKSIDIQRIIESKIDVRTMVLAEMQLLTQAIRSQFPPIGSTSEKDPSEVKVIAKFFTPDSQWTWYATEFDGNDQFFGMVHGYEKELGYFSLSELESATGSMGLHIERDMHFGEHYLSEFMK